MRYKSTSNGFHFVMSFLTMGAWLPVWIICYLSNEQHNKRVLFLEQMGRNRDSRF